MSNSKIHYKIRDWEAPLTTIEKGVPFLEQPLPLDQVGDRKWSLLAGDLPLPVAVLREQALLNNSTWMRRFLAQTGVDIAPHGKTTLAPALFDLQIADGAWAITVSTSQHFTLAVRSGFTRILMANQLIGAGSIRDVLRGLKANPDVEFFCLVDSKENVAALASAAREIGLARPLNALVELGYQGGRTGCRTVEEAIEVARQVAAESEALCLSGIEGFEGLLRNDGTPEVLAQIEALLAGMGRLAEMADAENLYGRPEVLLSAGGSSYFDLVATALKKVRLSRPTRVIIRSGCYITHDSHMYVRARHALARRSPGVAAIGDLQPALEVWAAVQSRPEAAKAIISMGKRDISYDDPPIALKWLRPGLHTSPQPAPAGLVVEKLNDQHCHLRLPEDSPLQVGDLVGFGISHPCLTFDKWRVLHLVDEAYQVTGSIRTYF
ncbi:amino acid deaminase [uncultured Ferrovibrio sp.]|jgi:D-serine dehydratase|uniref:amino acid deaminase n=1 Tax=uncultured Ferrovibrio sp. TaxID=1576913 RepID=UPI00263778A0|nr:amino acid deaminase [uncultured Ferrovibrio sp.]